MAKQHKGGLVGGFDQLRAPDAPTIGATTPGNGQVAVAFTAASNAGAGTVSSFAATGIVGGVTTGATATSSPVTVTGLTNGTEVTFSVIAISEFGASPSSGTVTGTPAIPLNTRALFLGGTTNGSARLSTVDFFDVASTGNGADFGNLQQGGRRSIAVGGSATRIVGMAGNGGQLTPLKTIDIIEYYTLASAGNAADFGDCTDNNGDSAAVSNSIRALNCGGRNRDGGNNSVNVIDFIVIASLGDATDFGDFSATRLHQGAFSSSTRGCIGGGFITNTSTKTDTIDYVTIATEGNGSDFGDLTVVRAEGLGGVSTKTRGVFAGGLGSSTSNVMDYVTIASTGNATDFGNLTVARYGCDGASTTTRGVFGGGSGSGFGPYYNTLDYITIASVGNASDFGDLNAIRSHVGAESGAHGGLQP